MTISRAQGSGVGILSKVGVLGLPLGWVWSRLAPPEVVRVVADGGCSSGAYRRRRPVLGSSWALLAAPFALALACSALVVWNDSYELDRQLE